jgi:manganese/zinc/iron transport system permease protein
MAGLIDDPAVAILLTGALVGLATAPLGLFLVLRGDALLSDAISHSIVFGIIVVWLLTGQVSGPLQLIGAGLTGLATVALSEALARTRLVRTDAAVGLVFPALFAAGVLLISLYARDVHIDPHAVLLGEIGFVWLDTVDIWGVPVPVAVVTLAAVAGLNVGFVALVWKELKLATFDAGLAAALGFAPALLSYALLTLTSVTAVAAFDAVGAVMFVAFVIAPPATALLLTDRLARALGLACAASVAATVSGYLLAVAWDVSIGGMMASMTGVLFALALVAGPRYCVIAQALARRGRRLENDCRTLAVHLHTHEDAPEREEENTARALREHLRWGDEHARRVILRSLDAGLIRRDGALLALTEKGEAVAREIFEPWARAGRR